MNSLELLSEAHRDFDKLETSIHEMIRCKVAALKSRFILVAEMRAELAKHAWGEFLASCSV